MLAAAIQLLRAMATAIRSVAAWGLLLRGKFLRRTRSQETEVVTEVRVGQLDPTTLRPQVEALAVEEPRDLDRPAAQVALGVQGAQGVLVEPEVPAEPLEEEAS